jgi:hypothetical protein
MLNINSLSKIKISKIVHIKVMKAEIRETSRTAKRIKVKVPYQAKEWRVNIKKIQGIWYHKEQKMWSVPNTSDNLDQLKSIFGLDFIIITEGKKTKQAKFEMSDIVAIRMEALITKMMLAGLSQYTIKAYRSELLRYLDVYKDRDMLTITKAEIETYVYELIKTYKISHSKQNAIINAIKYYHEKVLGQARTLYDITRPKPSKTLPNVLTEEDVLKLINTPTNIKHRTILYLLYSSGLRIGELPNLRLVEIKSSE